MKQNQGWIEYCKSLSPAIVETCAKTPLSAGQAGLVKALGTALPDWKFRHSIGRGGWYRLGGIVDPSGHRVSDSLESWVEDALDERDGNMGQLIDDFSGQELYATRLVGQTHYLVAQSGEAATKVMDSYATFTQAHPEVPWRSMRGMRNRIAHGYFDINLDVVWETVQTALP